MATVTESATVLPHAARSERRFYTFYTLGLLLLTLIGFSRSFYLSWVVPVWEPLPLSPLVVAHGITASALILLFPLQALLITRGKRGLHMATGALALALAALLIVLIYLAAAESFHRPLPPEREAMRPLSATLSLSLILLMPLFFWLGWRNRQNPQTHKRWMILAGCVLIAPAIARIPIMSALLPNNPALGFTVGTQALMFATVIPLWIRDKRTLGKVHRVTLWGSVLFFLVLALRVPFGFLAGPHMIAVLPGF